MNKIPKEEVLLDMHSDIGMVSSAARRYYYFHYASEKEKKAMDREDKIWNIVASILFVFMLIGIPLSFIFI